MTYTTVAAGDPIYAVTINDLIGYGPNRPAGRMVQTVAQTGIANATQTAVTFTTEDYDTHNFHSTSSNTSRVTPTVAGLYTVRGAVSVIGQTDYTFVESTLRFNGATYMAPATRLTPSATTGTLIVPVAASIACNGTTDYFELTFRLTRGGAGTSGTVISLQFASVLEWELSRSATS